MRVLKYLDLRMSTNEVAEFFFLRFIFSYGYVGMWVCAHACRVQVSRVVDSLGLEIQGCCEPLIWMLGIVLGS